VIEANHDGHLAGQAILAAADEDDAKLRQVVANARTVHGDDGYTLLVTVSAFAGMLAEPCLGDDWRSDLVTALNGLEMATGASYG
jgi:hypothetical protein